MFPIIFLCVFCCFISFFGTNLESKNSLNAISLMTDVAIKKLWLLLESPCYIQGNNCTIRYPISCVKMNQMSVKSGKGKKIEVPIIKKSTKYVVVLKRISILLKKWTKVYFEDNSKFSAIAGHVWRY